MADPSERRNQVKSRRLQQGWSQGELARRTGMSRTAVGAVERGLFIPSVTAALGLASALGCAVEELFGSESGRASAPEWAWPPGREPCRYWHARVGNRVILYPVVATSLGEQAHDGVFQQGKARTENRAEPEETLVVAGCDPAAGLLAGIYARLTGLRLLVLPRSSRAALDLLARGLVHVAGMHLGGADGSANMAIARSTLAGGVMLLRLARWQEGLALAPGTRTRSVTQVLRSRLTWVGREPGSGARQCLDELLSGRTAPRRQASDHWGVAEAVRSGWADVGVCLRLVSDEAGLRFLGVREEAYDLCFTADAAADPRIQGLIRTMRSASYRRLLGDLPGYDSSETGEVRPDH
jgi:molybdate-binding protein/DNA-binding XRE family transcriptional regulator